MKTEPTPIPKTGSMRLIEILQEEFNKLHGKTFKPKDPGPSDEKPKETKTPGLGDFYRIEPEQRILKLSEEKPQDTSDDNPGPDPEPSEQFKAFMVFSEERLKEWRGKSFGNAGDKPDVKALKTGKERRLPTGWKKIMEEYRIALEHQIADKDFVFKEEWVADGPLRPYTRALLEQYKTTYGSDFNLPVLSRRRRSGSGSMPMETSAKDQLQEDRATELNTLIVEDIFPEYWGGRADDIQLNELYLEMFSLNKAALCLSGGGIRSGTFALGVLQGLAELNIKPSDFTYMSTVSGGGYLGGWLSAWIRQEGADVVAKKLKPGFSFPLEPAPIRHLRTYSNYLSPKLGLFSADTWALVAIYLRNLVINWLSIIPFLAAFVCIPWIMVTFLNIHPSFWLMRGMFVLGGVLFIISDFFIKRNPPLQPAQETEKWKSLARDKNFITLCLLPGILAIICWVTAWYWFMYADVDLPPFFSKLRDDIVDVADGEFPFAALKSFVPVVIVFMFLEWVLYLLAEWWGVVPRRFDTERAKGSRWKEMLCLLVAGTLFGVILISMTHFMMPKCAPGPLFSILYACLAFPTVQIMLLFNGFVYEGLKSKFVEDAEREWMARYSGWFLVASLGWLILSGVILYGPYQMQEMLKYIFPLGTVTSFVTAYLGQKIVGGSKPGQTDRKTGGIMSYISLPLLAAVAVIILFIAISFLIVFLITRLSRVDFDPLKAAGLLPWVSLLVFAVMAAICLFFSRIIDMNRFSLHALYRSRLIRAYLGASRPAGTRRPDPFTGFDETDNLPMGDLVQANGTLTKPFHVINMALNLVAGENLAWQERKAASFTVSPLHAGSLLLGYRRTYQEKVNGQGRTGVQDSGEDPQKDQYYGGRSGITLGTALTISGAAVSPSSGYHTSPLVAFFMTLFNLRLGWWLGSPGPLGDNTYYLSSPKYGLKPLLSEMFGKTDELNPYIFLSDGGHFENLGLYEMVLRRNRFIILSDASCDASCELEDLGNAIRKIRIDHGITIDFPFEFNIHSRKAGEKGKYWALGRVQYPENKRNSRKEGLFGERDGILLYIKPSIYGGEAKDISNYASVNADFPHESTADQFFSESQFESYRALGLFMIGKVAKELRDEAGVELQELLNAQNTDEWKILIDAINKKWKEEPSEKKPEKP
ncbi:MAG: hypothetical protein KF870_10960 [Leadbetterella sp.]|nr:hypothetical protein [Leadbetterella sp.]